MFQLKRLLPFVAVLAIVGCGGTTPKATTSPAPAPTPTSRCVPGNSFMGCSTQVPGLGSRSLTVPAGRKFTDVSDWQPSVDWAAVKRSGIFAAVVKAGEGVNQDPTFESHLGGAKAAGLETMVYWFVRPVGCSAEAAAINRVAPRGVRVVFDEEVPGLAGYAACLKGPVQAHTGIVPLIYTSPGTWSGGSNAGLVLWQAEYGPTLHPVWEPTRAWQYTASASIPGISGSSDENVDLGLFPKPAPPLPKCFTHRITKSACAAAKKKIASDQRAAASSERAYKARGCPTLSQRVSWYSTQLEKHPQVKTASRKSALAASRRAYSERSCSVFRNRVEAFTGSAAAVKAAN
jgi:GH25 family lysozyme M1 (1,4-beta-N-acetylmuramidase)